MNNQLADLERLMNWERGVERTSMYTGEVYATRKDRRMADKPFKNIRERRRVIPASRRAKSVRDV